VAYSGLERCRFAALAPDREDGRQIRIRLTRRAKAYADAVTMLMGRLNRELATRVDLSTSPLAFYERCCRIIRASGSPATFPTCAPRRTEERRSRRN
jgi:hypothetical protein